MDSFHERHNLFQILLGDMETTRLLTNGIYISPIVFFAGLVKRLDFLVRVLIVRQLSASQNTDFQRTLECAGSAREKELEALLQKFYYASFLDGCQLLSSHPHDGR